MEENKKPLNWKLIAAAGVCGVVLVVGIAAAMMMKGKKAEEAVSSKSELVETEASASTINILCEPSGIAKMEDGSLLVTDTYKKQILLVKDGKSSVYAGGSTVEDAFGKPMGGYNDASPTESFFKYPWAIAPFLDGYAVSDTGNNVVRVVRKDSVQTLNASTEENLPTKGMGVAFSRPTGLAADEEGNLYISDTDENAIRKVMPSGELTTLVTGLSEPMGLCYQDGVLYVAETGANRIVKIQDGKIVPVAGSSEEGMLNGEAMQAAFSAPQGVVVGEDGTIYVSDTGNSAIRMVRDGQVTTLLEREAKNLETFLPVFPVGLMLDGNQLYVCDNFACKVFTISVS